MKIFNVYYANSLIVYIKHKLLIECEYPVKLLDVRDDLNENLLFDSNRFGAEAMVNTS